MINAAPLSFRKTLIIYSCSVWNRANGLIPKNVQYSWLVSTCYNLYESYGLPNVFMTCYESCISLETFRNFSKVCSSVQVLDVDESWGVVTRRLIYSRLVTSRAFIGDIMYPWLLTSRVSIMRNSCRRERKNSMYITRSIKHTAFCAHEKRTQKHNSWGVGNKLDESSQLITTCHDSSTSRARTEERTSGKFPSVSNEMHDSSWIMNKLDESSNLSRLVNHQGPYWSAHHWKFSIKCL